MPESRFRRSYSEHNQPPAAASDIRSEPPGEGRGVASAKRQVSGAPSLSGDRERVSDRRGGWTPYNGGELRFKGLDLACQLDRGEQLGALGDNAS